MSLPPPTIYDPLQHKILLPQVAEIHRACIHKDFTIATFLPPLTMTNE